ncbi:RHS repeat-associated core domain-containing protein [Streptomyces sp. NPDC052092]|uniref:RHS repeat-associated core domain-containing protein n=1 Tax=Streptomyces sp. NPDC052092 TaxID=3365685 RepID=UPI0037CF2A18
MLSLVIDASSMIGSSPAVGGLPFETVSYDYNATGQQVKSGGTTEYLRDATFSPQGDLRELRLGTGDKLVTITNSYEQGTRRLTGIKVADNVNSYPLQDLAFTQDDAGNVTSIFDTTTLGGAAKPDHQCFTYDGHSRVTEAWTPKTADCASAGRTTANIDGAAPYWSSYTYNEAGQRATEITHTSTGDKTTSYVYNDGTKDAKPHTLDKTTGDRTADYAYDSSGNTTSRPGPTAQQTLAWDAEGELSKVTEGTAQTGYLYDADGELLIRRASGDGDTILYFGNTEVRLTVKGTTKTVSGTRYYTANGQTIAVRTAVSGTSGTKLSFLASDHHGTSNVAIEAGTFTPTKRYTTPFGAPRGPQQYGLWPDDKGFLGKPRDTNTGLTHIGARAYDPITAQFISADPLLELDKHQTLNGYSYAAQNPLTHSDPSGMGLACGGAGGSSEGCPTRPGGDKGNGRPNEAVEGPPTGTHPCNSNCGISISGGEGTAQQQPVHVDDGCDWGPLSGMCRSVGEVFYGAISNFAYTGEFLGAIWDSDCRNDGGAGSPGCDYGAQYDQYMAEHGYDIYSDNYRAPSAVAAIFTHRGGVFPIKPQTRSGKPTYGDRGARSRAGTLTGKTTTKTHWARVEVTRDGELVLTYTLRSGSMTSGESQSSSHTETRVIRMSGTTSMDINGDPYSNLAPVSRGDTVTIHGLNAPCPSCQGRMGKAAQELGVTFVYKQGGKEWSWGG